jgi:hypothetical protein
MRATVRPCSRPFARTTCLQRFHAARANRTEEAVRAFSTRRRSLVARAFERSSAERLALDQSREGYDPTLRVLAQKQEHVDGLCERTAERLAAAQGELRDLHWWNRGSRAELKAQIARGRFALERADEKREQLRQHADRRSRFLVLAREHDERVPLVRPEPPRPRLEREPPGLGLGLEL